MNGFPKILNTKQDYLNCLEGYPSETKKELQRLLDDRFIWKNNGEIAVGQFPTEDATHKIITDKDGKVSQLELIEDEAAKIFRIGFTVEEVEELIGE